MAEPAIALAGLTKRYGEGATAVDALKAVDLQVQPGEVVGLIGPSGSGKSTLLKALGAVIEPSMGRLSGRSMIARCWRRKVSGPSRSAIAITTSASASSFTRSGWR